MSVAAPDAFCLEYASTQTCSLCGPSAYYDPELGRCQLLGQDLANCSSFDSLTNCTSCLDNLDAPLSNLYLSAGSCLSLTPPFLISACRRYK